jgi:glycogen synthase
MDSIHDSELTPIWGDKTKFDQDAVPWYVMAGRDDSRQKGYEVACIAIDQLLTKGIPARFIFFPIPGDEGLPGIEFIHELANFYPQHVICFPFLFKEGFFAVMRGATYGIMPSYYEPFGMANEYYLSGVVCIGRATGGICQQIVPNQQVSSFGKSAHKKAKRWHKIKSPATGFLYREVEDIPTSVEDWHSINNANYKLGAGISNRLNTRKKLPTVQSMADELAASIEDANQLYSARQGEYFEMLVNGIDYITSNFSWEKAAKSYLNHIKL